MLSLGQINKGFSGCSSAIAVLWFRSRKLSPLHPPPMQDENTGEQPRISTLALVPTFVKVIWGHPYLLCLHPPLLPMSWLIL